VAAASWSDGFQYSPKILGMPSYWSSRCYCHTRSQRSWLRFKEDFVEVAKTDLAVPENDLSVDSSRVGDLGVALEVAPSGALVAAGRHLDSGRGLGRAEA
jgi:hypothetical protein